MRGHEGNEKLQSSDTGRAAWSAKSPAFGASEQEPTEHHASDSTKHGLRSVKNGHHSWHSLVKLDASGIRNVSL